MARSQRKPTEKSSKKESLKVINIKNSGKVKKQSKDVTKSTKTKATIKCSKCSKVINSKNKNSKVKMCASCLKSISKLPKQKSVPPTKPKSLQTPKIKSPNKKTNSRTSTASNKNNPVTGKTLSNSKSTKSPTKTYKSPKKETSTRKSNDGANTKNNKNKTPVKSVKKDALQSNKSMEGKLGLRGKKRSYVQLASGISDDGNKAKKMKTAKAAVPIVRGTRDKKPTPKASEWLSTISPKRKSPKQDKKKASAKSVTPRNQKASTSTKKSVSPSKRKPDIKKNTPSPSPKKSVRQSKTKAESPKPSPPARKKVSTTPSTAKTTTPKRSTTRRSAKFTSDTVQKRTRNSPIVATKDDPVKSNDTDLKDSVLFAKEILEDILTSVGNDSVDTIVANASESNREINPHCDFTGSLENNVAECVVNDVTCEKEHNASTADDIELHLSPEKENELHISPKKGIKLQLSPEKDISLHLSPEKDIELHISPVTAENEMGLEKTEMDAYDHQDKDKLNGDIVKSVEVVDSYKSCSKEDLKTDSKEVDSKCHKSPKNTEPQKNVTNTVKFDDRQDSETNSISASDIPNDNILKTKENGISHDSHENISKITNICPLQSKGDLFAVASHPSSDTVSQGSSISLPIKDSKKHNKSQDEDLQSSVVLASEGTNNTHELSQHKSLDINSDCKIICEQALNKRSSEVILKSTENKITSSICLPEEIKSFECQEKCSSDTNLSSNGHIYVEENSTGNIKEANRLKNSQTLSEISPTVNSATHCSLEVSNGISHDKTKELHIMQNTFSQKSEIHSPATNNKEQIDAQVQLNENSGCHTEQEVVTAKNKISHIENSAIDKCQISNNKELTKQSSHFDENKFHEETQQNDDCKTELINNDEDSMSKDNVDLPTIDEEDCKNKINESSANSSDICKPESEKLTLTNEPKNQSDDLLLSNVSKKLEDCENKSDQLLPTTEIENLTDESCQKLPVKDYNVITDSLNKPCSPTKPTKHDFKNNVSDQITRESIDGLASKIGEEKCHKEPQLEESKTSQSDPSESSNRFETKMDSHQTEEVPYQKEQSPSIEEHKTTETNQTKLLPSDNEIKINSDETVKEQSPENKGCRTPQNDETGIFYCASEVKEDKRGAGEETQSCQKEEPNKIIEEHSNKSEVLATESIIKPDEAKTEDGPSCKDDQLLQIEECKTTPGDEKGMLPSEFVVKTDEENTSNVPIDSEVVSRMESPMNVDNKTDFDNNENCNELTLKIEESREECISIDGTDVESMQCNSETRSSNRMSVDEEVITMDIDQDDTIVDGSDCQKFGMKVSNELNMEVN